MIDVFGACWFGYHWGVALSECNEHHGMLASPLLHFNATAKKCCLHAASIPFGGRHMAAVLQLSGRLPKMHTRIYCAMQR